MKGVFVVFDSVAEDIVAGIMWLKATPLQAVREFQDIASNPESLVAKHPGDHVLYHLGVVEGLTFTPFPEPQRLGSAVDLMRKDG